METSKFRLAFRSLCLKYDLPVSRNVLIKTRGGLHVRIRKVLLSLCVGIDSSRFRCFRLLTLLIIVFFKIIQLIIHQFRVKNRLSERWYYFKAIGYYLFPDRKLRNNIFTDRMFPYTIYRFLFWLTMNSYALHPKNMNTILIKQTIKIGATRYYVSLL